MTDSKARRSQGRWCKKLIVRFMSKDAIPNGGGLSDGIKFLSNPKAIGDAARKATALAFEAIDAVRNAPDCKWTTDEEIAEQIVLAIEARTDPLR